MTKLKEHGEKIGQLQYLTKSVAFMSDGTVWVNKGQGWKIQGQIKAGDDIEEIFQRRKTQLETYEREHPKYRMFKERLYKEVSLSAVSGVLTTFEVLGNDVDGCHVELEDYWNISIGLDSLYVLVSLWEQAVEETRKK